MFHVPVSPPDSARQRDAVIIAYVVALVHARRKGDYLTAADAHRELVRLGVLVRFPRQRKGVDNV
ncbi:MAG TPA: hypothetical protein VHQ47_13345 [Phycisphaerae bacterium]|nr:hypothetical protein [Phycisphaerae bacterium]